MTVVNFPKTNCAPLPPDDEWIPSDDDAPDAPPPDDDAQNPPQAQQPPTVGFQWIEIDELLTAELPAQRWVVPGLELGPGRPCGVQGLGSAGKSWSVYSTAISVASGLPCFGHFECNRGKVAIVSHEMGRRVVLTRCRQLANGMGLELADLADRFRVTCLPKIFLNTPGAEDIYKREFEGVDYAVIDSLRRALPGEDENDSSISNFLDILNRTSDATGTTFQIVHHTGKGSPEDKRHSGRGSSAIFDGSGSIWLQDGEGTSPRKLTQIRPHESGEGGLPPFWLLMERVAQPEPVFSADGPPVRLVYRSAADFQQVIDNATLRRGAELVGQLQQIIFEAVRANPGITKAQLELELTTAKRMGQTQARQTVKAMLADGALLTEKGGKNADKLYARAVR